MALRISVDPLDAAIMAAVFPAICGGREDAWMVSVMVQRWATGEVSRGAIAARFPGARVSAFCDGSQKK